MAKCCPVCYKVGGDGNPNGSAGCPKGEGLQRTFFKSLERYINEGTKELTNDAVKRRKQRFPFPLQKFPEIGMLSCGDCSKIMESFSKSFHQLKTIELLLNWEVQKLKGAMMGAQRIPSRMKSFRGFILNLQVEKKDSDWKNVEELMSHVVKTKKSLIAKCSEKVANSFPKLEMPKCDAGSTLKSRSKPVQVSTMVSAGNVPEIDLQNSSNIPYPTTIESGQMLMGKPCSKEQEISNKRKQAESTHLTLNLGSCQLLPTIRSELEAAPYDGNRLISPLQSNSINEPTKIAGERNVTAPTTTNEQIIPFITSDEGNQTHSDHQSIKDSNKFPTQLNAGENVPIPEKEMHGQGESQDICETVAFSDIPDYEIDVDDGEPFSQPEELTVNDEASKFIEDMVSKELAHITNFGTVTARANAPPADNPESSTLNENSGRKSGLRSKHACPHCRKTFSTPDRLQSHAHACHDEHDQSVNMTSSNEVDSSASENEDNDSIISSDGMNYSSSADSDQEDDCEQTFSENAPCSLDVKPASNLDPMKQQKLSKLSLGQETIPDKYRLRLKCPDCDELYQTFKSFLLHRKDSESCKASYNPTTNVRVEVLAPELNAESDLDQPRFSTFAIINLQQAIFICDDCGLALYSVGDFEKHKELHGEFCCNFCDFKSTFAPTLSMHELQHSKVSEGKWGTGPLTNCPRCDVQFTKYKISRGYVRHHLKVHFSLIHKEPTCAICKTTSKDLGPSELAEHLKSHHELSSNTNLMECTVVNCGAYYLTKYQLQEHQKVHHVHGNAKGGSRNCKDCNKRFASSKVLRRHRLECHPEYASGAANKCPHSECLDIFESKRDLEIHIKKKHSGDRNMDELMKLKCPDCSLLFNNLKEILLHRQEINSCEVPYDPTTCIRVEVVEVTPEGEGEIAEKNVYAVVNLPQEIYFCEDCGHETFSVEDRESHSKLHGSFQCNFCRHKVKYAPDIAKHERRHIYKRPFKGNDSKLWDGKCPRCDYKWSQGGGGTTRYIHHHLTTHMSLAFHETRCAICKVTVLVTKGQFNLAHHLKQFHDLRIAAERPDKIMRCTLPNCSAYFLTSRQLQNHLRFRHNTDIESEKKKWKCKDCDKCYTLPSSLRDHRLKYHVESDKVIPCAFENCAIVFESKEDLVSHLKASSFSQCHQPLDDPTKMVHCPTCEASFRGSDPNLLNEHMKSQHRAEKPTHVCEFCGKVFKDKDRLGIHYLSHSGPGSWQFQCSVCSKKCMTKGKLEEHMRTHTKDKPFVCQVCGQAYAHRHNLRIHVNNKHGDQVQDIPRKVNKINPTVSRKGIKRKLVKETLRESSSDSDAV